MVKTIKETISGYWDSLSAKLLPYIPEHDRRIGNLVNQHNQSIKEGNSRLKETKFLLEQTHFDLDIERENSDKIRSEREKLESKLEDKDEEIFSIKSQLQKTQDALILNREEQEKAKKLVISGIISDVKYQALQDYVSKLQNQIHQVQSLRIRELIEDLSPKDIAEISQVLEINLTDEYINAERIQREQISKLESALTKLNGRSSHVAVKIAEAITTQYKNLEKTQSFIYSPESGVILKSKPLERTLKRNIFDLEDLETYSQDFVSGSREIFDIGSQNHELRFSRVKLPYNSTLYIGYITPRREDRKKPFKKIKQTVESFSRRLGKSIESEYATLEIKN